MQGRCTLALVEAWCVLIYGHCFTRTGLNEVFTGGLSSYAVFNLVYSHLQCEGAAPPWRQVVKAAASSTAAATTSATASIQRVASTSSFQSTSSKGGDKAGGRGGGHPQHRQQPSPSSGLEPALRLFLQSLGPGHQALHLPQTQEQGRGSGSLHAVAGGRACDGGGGGDRWHGWDLGDLLQALLYR